MLPYVVKRLLLMLPTLGGVALVVFVLMRVLPGDVVELRFAGESSFATKAQLDIERRRLGLDQPLWLQFVQWIEGVVRLDFGRSMWTGGPISREIALRWELSLEVAILATTVAVLLAIPLGLLAAVRQDTWVDYAVRLFSIAGLAVPSFWLGILMILGLLVAFGWLPPIEFTPVYVSPGRNLAQLVWPALAVGYRYCAVTARMIRSSLLEVLSEDYIRTARAKGVFERLVVSRHALRNALLPAITVIGLEFTFLIGGLVVTEQVFNLNGIGKLFVQSVSRNDFTLIQGMVMLIAVFYVFTNLVIDLLYAVFDPRIRYG